MDHEMLKRDLAQADAHIKTGYKNLALQRQVIAKLQRDGHDTTAARATLDQFEEQPTAREYCASLGSKGRLSSRPRPGHNDGREPRRSLRSVALCLFSHCAGCLRHF
jgi:hypothetical protein